MHRQIAGSLTGRVTKWVVVVLWLAVAVVSGIFGASKLSTIQDNQNSSYLPGKAESTQVLDALSRARNPNDIPTLVVYERSSGLTQDDLTELAADAKEFAAVDGVTGKVVGPIPSKDGKAAQTLVTVNLGSEGFNKIGGVVDRFRSIGTHSGLSTHVTGPGGQAAAASDAFSGLDSTLLYAAIIVVVVILLITYRSPVLWILPVLSAGVSLVVAQALVYVLAKHAGLVVNGQSQGILTVLVFGAGTDYALLLVARYREELGHESDRFRAMRTAVTSAGPAIAASGGTVALSLLTLLLASLSTNRALGFACAVGVVVAIAFALVALPAALAVCGRGLFWPFVPRVAAAANVAHAAGAGTVASGPAAPPRGFWAGLGTRVSHRPVVVSVVSVLGLGVLALGLSGYAVGLSQTAQLLGNPASVSAQAVIDRSFSAGLTSRTSILTPDADADRAVAIAAGTTGVESATAGEQHAGLTDISVTLTAEPESDAAFATIDRLRAAYSDAGGTVASTLVGGTDATALDTLRAAEHDRDLVIPIILAIVFVVLLILLRSLVAPVLLIASVLATFFASLGASTFLFTHLLGFAALDSSVTLFAFLFLVALGVDYNIFLTTRAREEAALHGTRPGMIRALSSTGAVITSAGVLLAAVFAVLGVLPVVALTQVGVIVCIGVLLDTLVVRTVLVPALVFLTGNAFWWPSRPHHAAHAAPSAAATP